MDFDSEKEYSSADNPDSSSKEYESNFSNIDKPHMEMKCTDDANTSNAKNECSELNVHPIVCQKFQFLICVLKDIQVNIQEMDNLIMDGCKTDSHFTSDQPSTTMTLDNSSANPMVNADDSSKTDETKLKEILSLLHRITGTLSAFEENPLLRDDRELLVENLAEGKVPKQSEDVNTSCCSVSDDTELFCSRRDANFVDSSSINSYKMTTNPQITCVDSPFHRSSFDTYPQRPFQENTTRTRSLQELDKEPHDHHHRFRKKTKSLRGEIEAVLRRKEALDEKLKRLIMERQKDKSSSGEERWAAREEITVHHSFRKLPSESGSQESKSTYPDRELEKDGGKRYASPARKEEFIQNEEAILNELRNEENEIPGLAESGLSSEIDSLSLTIKDILKENHKLHSICSEFSDQIPSTGEKKSNWRDKADEKYTKDVIATPNKRYKEDTERRKRLEPPTKLEASTGVWTEDKRSGQRMSRSNAIPSDPVLRASFDKKIRGLLKEQTNMIKLLQKEKRSYHEKCYSLEQMVTELTKLNRESSSRLVEELHTVDVENCRLENELQALKRENWKLVQDRMRRSFSLREGTGIVTVSKSQKFSLEDESITAKDNSKEGSPTGITPLNRQSYKINQISMSHNDLPSTLQSECNIHQFLSLPTIINQGGQDNDEINYTLEDNPHIDFKTEVKDLKDRMNSLEIYFQKQMSPQIVLEAPRSAENEVLLKQRINLLTSERDAANKKMEELMQIARDLSYHFRATREELENVKREKKFVSETLLKKEKYKEKLTTSEIFPEDKKETVVSGEEENSTTYLNLIVKLEERCHFLQMELERARQETHRMAMEKQTLALEKDHLNRLFTTSLAQIEEENGKLRAAITKMEVRNSSITENKMAADDRAYTKDRRGREELQQGGTENKITVVAQIHQEEEENDNIADTTITATTTTDNGGCLKNSRITEEEMATEKWQKSLLWLQRCIVEEKLHSQLLEAAQTENSARVDVMQEAVKRKGEKYRDLLAKYKKLHSILLSSKVEKRANKKMLKECTTKIEEFNSTTSAIEDNYKVMLSSLGNNIAIAVDILSSHLYFSPSQIHPSPELSTDAAFWFAAQCSRLRWLQANLRKLCVHSWKGGSIGDLFPQQENVFTKRQNRKKKTTPQSERENTSKENFERNRSLDLDPVGTPLPACDLSRLSHSFPNSPTHNGTLRDSRGRGGVVEELVEWPPPPREKEKSVSDDAFSTPSLTSGILLSSLNESEINLTNQQAKLVQNKRLQFHELVDILRQNSSKSETLFKDSPLSSFQETATLSKQRFSDTDDVQSNDHSLTESGISNFK